MANRYLLDLRVIAIFGLMGNRYFLGNHRFFLFPDHFFLSTSGQLRLQKQVDRETKSELIIKVQAIDNGTPQMTSQTDLIIKVIDVNDVTPVFRPVVIKPVLEV